MVSHRRNLDKKAIFAELQKRAAKPKIATFTVDEYCFDKQLEFIKDPAKIKTAVCSRRCLAKGTLVQTTNGPKEIQNITINDYVYSEHGQPIKVLKVYDNGDQLVTEVYHNKRPIFSATKNHVMLTQNTYKDSYAEKKLQDFNCRDKIVRIEVDREEGINVPYAYAIGALLGDGCSKEKGLNRIYFSSEDSKIPNKVGELLGATKIAKNGGKNFTYAIHLDRQKWPKQYVEWCHNKYAHEKTCDIGEILSWDRSSRLAFLAGLIDTDGSVMCGEDGITIAISMQAKKVIEAANILFLDLFNTDMSKYIDNRPKYRNGPVYVIRKKHNYASKKALKALTEYMLTERKKWNPSWESKLENNYRPDRVSVTFGKEYVTRTYDIHVNSPTNLYMLANGLITHNSGKSEACAADLVDTAYNNPRVNCLYITLSRTSAERIIWRLIMNILKDKQIPHKANNKELIVSLENGSHIYVSGAKDSIEIEKFRGLSLKKVYIDECQSFKSYIKELVEDVLMPATWDVNGQVALIGTPGPIPQGYFFDMAHNKANANYKWNIMDNPWIFKKSGMKPEKILADERERKGITEADPTYMREALGLWVQDSNALVFRFDKRKNIFDKLPEQLNYIFGVDLGWNDADSIAVLGYSLKDPNVYLVEECITKKQNITSLVEQIKEMQTRYKPIKIVVDAGALGKKIIEEIRSRHGINAEAASKERKLEFIELLNDDLRTGKLKAFKKSVFEEDCNMVVWEYSGAQRIISDRTHSDICDSVLYAWRECKHYMPKDEPYLIPNKNSNEFMDMLEQKDAEASRKAESGENEDWPIDQDDMDSIFDTYDRDGMDDY